MAGSVFTDAYSAFLAVLVAARHEAGLTQLELAERLRKPQSFVSKFERGERRLDIVEFSEIARAMQRDPIDLLRVSLERSGLV
jgi:transcriptional regulator with XRE-family HTH domain